jgi:hypothetical protein
MPLQAIPGAWKKNVCAALETESDAFIQWTKDARQRYECSPGAIWVFEAYAAFRAVLRQPTLGGCRVLMEKPSGESYEFYVPFKGAVFYGKILLRDDLKRIVIFSIHPQLKDKLSCES